MNEIKEIEKAMTEGMEINHLLRRACLDRQESGNELIDFSECIWEQDIPEIVRNLRAAGIEAFTVSSTMSGLIETLAAFEDEGCTMESRLVTVNSKYKDFFTDEPQKVKAIKIKVN